MMRVAGADGTGGLDVLLVLDGQHRGAHDPREGRNIGNTDGQHHVGDTGAHGRHQGDGQQNAGDRQKDVHDAHDDVIYPTAAIAGDSAQQAAHHGGDGDGDKGHRQGDPGTVDDAGQNVPAHLVSAQPVLGRGGLELQRRALLDHQGLIVKQQVGKNSQEDNDSQNNQSHHGHFVLFQAAPDRGRLGFLLVFLDFRSHPLTPLPFCTGPEYGDPGMRTEYRCTG